MNRSAREREAFAKRVLAAVGITLSVILLLLFIWFAADVLLLAFAGILLAIFLHSLSDWISQHTRLTNGKALAVVIVGLCIVIGLSIWRLVPDVADQIDQLSKTLPQSVYRVEEYLSQYSWGRQLLNQVPSSEEMPDRANALIGKVAGFFSTTLGALMNVLLFLIIGIYLAAEPKLYTEGMIRLVAISKRPRAREVLHAVGDTLRWWLVGQIFSMLIIGVLTTTTLLLLGIPLALVLGLWAALLAFIPNIGPILAVIPAALLAFLDSPIKALYVFLLYLAIQLIETYLLTPFVQRRTISLPPALTITGQIVFGVLFGGLGLMLATPMIAATAVLVDKLYIEDTLGDFSAAPHLARTNNKSVQSKKEKEAALIDA